MDDPVEPRVTRDALRSYFPNGRFENRLVPVPDHGCIYIKNAKAGTGTILLWLHRIHTGDVDFAPEGVHAEHQLPHPKEIGWETVLRMLNGDGFRFTFVRHPIRRVESAYLDKVLRHRRYPGRAQLQRILGLPEGREHDLTFDQFVAALEAQEHLEMDVHWRPQHLNLMHGLITYDFVGRLENFDTDLARVRELTGLPDVPAVVQSATRKPQVGLFEGRPDLVRRVRDIYARDFELYGY